MKENEAPEKIYINSNIENRTWLIGKGDTSFIEYIRTDTFFEKALGWMISQGGVNDALSKEMIDDFRKYIKGN